MQCPECSTANPEVARFCYRCGHALKRADASKHGRNNSYVVQSSEGVNQLALISTIMPHTNRETADNYRWAMITSALLIVGATALGILSIAIASAAFLIPIAYLVYIYDVNLWEDAPVPVVLGLFAATGVLATLVSLVFFRWVFDSEFSTFVAGSGTRGGFGTLSVTALLIFAVLLPIVAEIVKNLFGCLLARRPEFDDMIDGLTFGVAAGTAYAAFETIVVFWSVFTSSEFRTTAGLSSWVVVIVNLMVVKSLIYGTASGIAVGAFSGKGEGYDGFTPHYVANFAFAAGANVVYWLGVRLFAYAPFGQVLGLLWGLLILGILVIRVRVSLQHALLEAAVEDAVRDHHTFRETGTETFCPECGNMLLPGSLFCIACGTSVRSTSHQARRDIRSTSGGGAA
ncbi:MAG: zinc-ribbon domain-containing protein [Actinobacteria bacterium]|nr:zinc-ribbon domain-containing protein [Actinomycetota bacterium]